MNWMRAGSGVALILMTLAPLAAARDRIAVVGSSTVFPFTAAVAERFAWEGHWPSPKVETTGSGSGFKLFCQSIDPATPDITAASRRMLPSELAQCRAHGVTHVTELVIGYDGIVVATSANTAFPALNLRNLYLALARWVPAADGAGFVLNPYRTWRQIDAALPDVAIKVFGPPPTAGTRDAFDTLAMQAGCRRVAAVRALQHTDPGQFRTLCRALREDGAYVEVSGDDNLVVRRVEADAQALGVIGFSYLERNRGGLHAVAIDGALPDAHTITLHSYPLARPLYLYVKASHVGVVPGLADFLREFTSAQATGADGYLVDAGLIAAPTAVREAMARRAARLTPLTPAALNEGNQQGNQENSHAAQ